MNGAALSGMLVRHCSRDKIGFQIHNMRIFAALAASAMAHAGVFFLPYLGLAISGAPAPRYAAISPRAVTVLLSAPAAEATGRRVAEPPPGTLKPPADVNSVTQLPPANAIGADLLPIRGMPFYPTDQLSKRPQPVEAVDFDSPELGGIANSGKIVLRLWIDEKGAVADVKLERTDLPEAITGPIIAIFKRSQFLPGERGGQRVGSIMKIEVDIDTRPPLR